MKRILITGAFGQLGSSCLERLHTRYELLATGPSLPDTESPCQTRILDITSPTEVEAAKKAFGPDVILNLAAMTDVDGCEREPEKARVVNTTSLKHLLTGFEGHFIQLSTDYVFDGEEGPYAETDPLNPINVYGHTKAEADRQLLETDLHVTILRANVIFGYTERTRASFVKWVVDSLAGGVPIQVVEDQVNNPTWTDALAAVIDAVIEEERAGVFHYGGAELLTRYEFALKIADVFHLDKNLIRPISTSELHQVAPRPLRSGLRTEKVERELGISPYPVETCLQQIRLRMNP